MNTKLQKLMFNKQISIEKLNEMNQNTLISHLGIELVEVGDDFIVAKMPVDNRTHQPFGLLHGGASVVLAESLGSLASTLTIDITKQAAVGLEINANHVRGVRSGWVYGKATPLHIGRTTQIWEIKITNEEDKLVCISRLTMAIIDRK